MIEAVKFAEWLSINGWSFMSGVSIGSKQTSKNSFWIEIRKPTNDRISRTTEELYRLWKG